MVWTQPKKGKVARKAACDLWRNTVKLRNKQISSYLIGLLLKGCEADQAVEFKNLVVNRKEESEDETWKQGRALNNIIFGKHYSIDTYENIMLTLYQAETQKEKIREEKQKEAMKQITEARQAIEAEEYLLRFA